MPEEEQPLVCVPGQRLCLADDATISGSGTYERLGYIYAQLAGTVSIRTREHVGRHFPARILTELYAI